MWFKILEFIILTVGGYFFYYKFFIKANEKKKKKPLEFAYLESRYLLRLDRVNLVKLGKLVSLCNAMIIAFTVVVIGPIKTMFFQLASGFLILVTLIVLIYYFIGSYYKKKGMTKRCTILQK